MRIKLLRLNKIAKSGWISIHQKKWDFKGKKIKYIHLKNHSKSLCVVFSAFPQEGEKPYIRTLSQIRKHDYLFILDDMVNIPTGGSYYLGSDGEYWGIQAVPLFIKEIADGGGI